ncbi:MAG: hypothetical protein IJR83_04360 [Clostridia bacterium]|nr:hypothetical protein [Clostridia bacterium]
MEQTTQPSDWRQKKQELFLRQKNTLDLFLERGAITKEQYEKSLHDLQAKMFKNDGT